MIRFGLKNTVGPRDPVGREDALAVKRALAELGDYEAGPDGVSPWPDGAMINALRRSQGRNGLYSAFLTRTRIFAVNRRGEGRGAHDDRLRQSACPMTHIGLPAFPVLSS